MARISGKRLGSTAQGAAQVGGGERQRRPRGRLRDDAAGSTPDPRSLRFGTRGLEATRATLAHLGHSK